jgi:aldehyde dehydrogenase family protein
LEAGTVWINQHAVPNPFVPMSAYKDSGLGVEFGQEGLEAFCNIQVIAAYPPSKPHSWRRLRIWSVSFGCMRLTNPTYHFAAEFAEVGG